MPQKSPLLSQEKICDAALKLINSEGLETLSMRKLATNLDVEAASLYNHIASKNEIFDLLQEHLFKQFPPISEDLPWQDYVQKFAVSMRDGLLKYPNLVPLFATRPSISASALKQSEKMFGVLLKAGFSESHVVFIYQSLAVFVLGHALAQVGRTPGSMHNESGEGITKIDVSKYPNIMKVYATNYSGNYDEWFNFGLKIIITGLEKVLQNKEDKK